MVRRNDPVRMSNYLRLRAHETTRGFAIRPKTVHCESFKTFTGWIKFEPNCRTPRKRWRRESCRTQLGKIDGPTMSWSWWYISRGPLRDAWSLKLHLLDWAKEYVITIVKSLQNFSREVHQRIWCMRSVFRKRERSWILLVLRKGQNIRTKCSQLQKWQMEFVDAYSQRPETPRDGKISMGDGTTRGSLRGLWTPSKVGYEITVKTLTFYAQLLIKMSEKDYYNIRMTGGKVNKAIFQLVLACWTHRFMVKHKLVFRSQTGKLQLITMAQKMIGERVAFYGVHRKWLP